MLVDTKAETYVVLGCSDAELAVMQIVEYDRLRFQIDLIFHDAKQFTGLTHCQARSKQKLDFHLFCALSSKPKISMNTFIRRAYNCWLVGHLLYKLGLTSRFGLNNPQIQ